MADELNAPEDTATTHEPPTSVQGPQPGDLRKKGVSAQQQKQVLSENAQAAVDGAQQPIPADAGTGLHATGSNAGAATKEKGG